MNLDAGKKCAEQKRRISRFVNAMTDDEARAFISNGHNYRRELLIEKLGVYGQAVEDITKRKVGVKLGIIRNSR